MTFNPFDIDLPITKSIPEIRQHLSDHQTLIVHAPPGAGKSTLVPLSLFSEPWLAGKKVVMMEPRRLATSMIANRMADLLGEECGLTVGYRIRFDSKISKNTKIEVITEAILSRMMLSDNNLTDVGLIIFDEFHERNIHADIALALCQEVQRILRPDLRILIMSATLDVPELSSLLQASVIESIGKQYPVEIIHTAESNLFQLEETTAQVVMKAVREKEGDILVFLPGQSEITKCFEMLRKSLPAYKIYPLYGMLTKRKQYQAIVPDREGKRKIVLATSIAETSLTIEGVKIVIDSGFGRTSRFDPGSGISKLETIRIAKDSADQRAGRAGRLSPGVCYRMWSFADHNRLSTHRVPEILEADLCSTVLDLALWGISGDYQLNWITPPPPSSVKKASETLHQLGALENGKITEHGRKIHELPCHPRISQMLLMAEDAEMAGLASDLAAILEDRDPLQPEVGIDINLRVEALRRYRANRSNGGKFGRIEKIAQSYRNLLKIPENNNAIDPYESGVLLAHAFPERIAHATPGNNNQYRLSNGRYATIGHQDDLSSEPWLSVAHIDARDGLGKIFLASRLNPKDLRPFIRENEVITWDTKKGGLQLSKELRIGTIVLQSTPLKNPNLKKIHEVLCDAVTKEGELLFDFTPEVKQLQNRVSSIKQWTSDASLPNFESKAILGNCRAWLTPYLNKLRKPEDFIKINFANLLYSQLSWGNKKTMEQLAPESIKVPTGSNIKLTYSPLGESPVLSVRLQEIFGMLETPTVNSGKKPVLMHLLSPGYKVVQITADLKSFWKNAYFEVRKDLRIRYPKHSWPEDPINAKPIKN